MLNILIKFDVCVKLSEAMQQGDSVFYGNYQPININLTNIVSSPTVSSAVGRGF